MPNDEEDMTAAAGHLDALKSGASIRMEVRSVACYFDCNNAPNLDHLTIEFLSPPDDCKMLDFTVTLDRAEARELWSCLNASRGWIDRTDEHI